MANELRPEPLADRGRIAALLIGLVVLAALGSLWADTQQLDLLNRAAEGERFTLAEAQDSDDRVATMALIYAISGVLAGITFLLWYSRAYRNVEALGVSRPRWGRRWAIAYWFIPIVNLFRPKQVMNDIWRGSDPKLSVHTITVEKHPVSPLLHWWWAAWLLSVWVANFAIRRTFENDVPSIDNLRTEATAYVVTDVADVIAGVLAILVIRRITARQEERRQAFESGTLPGQQTPAQPAVESSGPPAAAPAES